MTHTSDHERLDIALRDAGSSWNASQTHGLASGRLAVMGAAAGPDWLGQVLDGCAGEQADRADCEQLLESILATTHEQLAERMSRFAPLLPADDETAGRRTQALADWCEAYLHGLVSQGHDEPTRQQLAAEPVAGIIKDMLAIAQATVDEDDAGDSNERAYLEVVEYVRVAAQLVYEELEDLRTGRQS